MSTERTQELRNMRLERGGKYARSGTRVEVEVEKLMRERFYALQRENGRARRDAVVYNIAEGRTFPIKRIREVLTRLKRLHVQRELAWDAVIDPTMRVWDDVYGITGEHVPPAA